MTILLHYILGAAPQATYIPNEYGCYSSSACTTRPRPVPDPTYRLCWRFRTEPSSSVRSLVFRSCRLSGRTLLIPGVRNQSLSDSSRLGATYLVENLAGLNSGKVERFRPPSPVSWEPLEMGHLQDYTSNKDNLLDHIILLVGVISSNCLTTEHWPCRLTTGNTSPKST